MAKSRANHSEEDCKSPNGLEMLQIRIQWRPCNMSWVSIQEDSDSFYVCASTSDFDEVLYLYVLIVYIHTRMAPVLVQQSATLQNAHILRL